MGRENIRWAGVAVVSSGSIDVLDSWPESIGEVVVLSCVVGVGEGMEVEPSAMLFVLC